MQAARLPLDTWLVIDRSRNGHIVSVHDSADEAEQRCHELNGARLPMLFAACIAIEPVAKGMSRPRL
jgi:hypothetical protein